MKHLLITLMTLALLSGCASNGAKEMYQAQVDARTQMASASSVSDIAAYAACAKDSNPGTCVALYRAMSNANPANRPIAIPNTAHPAYALAGKVLSIGASVYTGKVNAEAMRDVVMGGYSATQAIALSSQGDDNSFSVIGDYNTGSQSDSVVTTTSSDSSNHSFNVGGDYSEGNSGRIGSDDVIDNSVHDNPVDNSLHDNDYSVVNPTTPDPEVKPPVEPLPVGPVDCTGGPRPPGCGG